MDYSYYFTSIRRPVRMDLTGDDGGVHEQPPRPQQHTRPPSRL